METALLICYGVGISILAAWGWRTAWKLAMELVDASAAAKNWKERHDELMNKHYSESIDRKFGVTSSPDPKKSPFDAGDKLPADRVRRYVPIATRRAQAEAASMGPKSHSDQVVANNARAFEGA